MLNRLKKSRFLFSVSHILKKKKKKTRQNTKVPSCQQNHSKHPLLLHYWRDARSLMITPLSHRFQLGRQRLTRCKLPALQQFRVNGMLSTQRSLFALAGRLALEGDAFLHRWMAEGVGTPAELHAVFRVVVGESGRGTWRGVTRRLLILLRRRDRCQRMCKNLFHRFFTFMTFSISYHSTFSMAIFSDETDWDGTSERVA